ncbi:MAG: T9SS type A sorting domain-containing protein [Chitinophagales bacterium]|nr:T9SS type A sorting domain-containing protein [Chitinophagales bacterium]
MRKYLLLTLLLTTLFNNIFAQSPGGISTNLVSWYKANTGVTTSGATVTQWNDQIGSFHLVRNASSTPTYITSGSQLLNYNPCIMFDNTAAISQYLYNLSTYWAAATSPYTIISVAKDMETTNLGRTRSSVSMGTGVWTGIVPDFSLVTNGTSPTGWSPYIWNSTPTNYAGDSAILYNGNFGGSNQQPQIFGLSTSNGGSNNVYSYVDGFNKQTNLDANSTQDPYYRQKFYVGCANNNTELWKGAVSEAIIYNKKLTDAEMLKVNTYLALKYGITLDQRRTNNYTASSGTVIYNASSFGAYNHDIAGIGKDNGSGLLQLKSTSVNEDAKVTIEANTANVTDLEFLVWANNDLNYSPSERLDIPASTGITNPIRLGRIWHVQETGDVGNVTLDFNIKDMAFITSAGFKLLVRNGSDVMSGATISSITPTIIGDTIVRFTNVPFANDDYFTLLGSTIVAPGDVASNLKLWYKANDGILSGDGTAVSQWNNSLNGSTYHVTQSTATNRPLFYSTSANQQINYNPSLRFDGSNDFLVNTSRFMSYNAEYAFFIVAIDSAEDEYYRSFFSAQSVEDYFSLNKNTTLSSFNSIIPYALLGYANYFGSFGKGTTYSPYTGAYWNGSNFTRDATVKKAQAQVVGMRSVNNIASDKLITYVDGYKDGPNYEPNWTYINRDASSSSRSYHFAMFKIGANGDASANHEFWRGNYAEFIAYDRNITDAEANKIQSYLGIKYGITLGQGNGYVGRNGNNFNYVNSSGTTIWNGTTNTAYGYDIFGIGRDDNQALNQKQSKSINGGFQPAISLNNGLATNNVSNANTFSADASYLIAGHNGLTTNYDVSYTPITFSSAPCMYIMNRIWKVQETGTVGNVTVTIPIITPAAATTTYMVVNNSASFGAGTSEILMTDDGNGNLTAQVDFTSGQYFTFVQPVTAPGGVTANLKVWYKTNDGVLSGDGSTVTTWTNSATGSSYNVTQATAAYKPKFYNTTSSKLVNNYPSIEFDGTDDQLNNSTRLFATTDPFEMLAVGVQQKNNGTPSEILGMGNDGNCPAFGMNAYTTSGWYPYVSTGIPVGYTASNAILYNGFAGGNNQQAQIYGMSTPNGGTDNVFSNVDGYSESTTLDANGSAYIGNMVWVGNTGSAEFFKGLANEIIIYNKKLTATEQLKVNSYLAIKYGITLDQRMSNDYIASDGTSIYAASTFGNYKYDIAGIGMDICSGLLQPKSTSANEDAVVTMEANKANISNLEFLTWANNDLAIAPDEKNDYPSSGLPTYDCPGRVNRIWHIQKVGDVGNVTLSFNAKNIPIVKSTDVRLLVRNGSDVMSGATISSIIPTIIGDTIRFANVPFSNNDYFTIVGDAIEAPGGITNHLVAWYKADDATSISLSGSRVTQWNDKAGNRNLTTFTSSGSPTYPKRQTAAPYLLNYNPSLEFDNDLGTYQLLSNTTRYFSNTKGFHLITIGKDLETVDVLRATAGMGDNGNYPGLDLEDDVTNGWNFVMDLSSPCYYYAQCGTQTGYPLLYNGYTGGTNQQAQIYSVGSTNTATTVGAANNIYTYIDGYKWLTDMDAYQQTYIGNNLYVGSSGADALWDGLIGEILIYDGLLSDAELLKVNSYLAIKYGITLNQDQANDYIASDGTSIYAASSFGAYDHDIAGIGQDICSGLFQPKSTSVNEDAVVTISANPANMQNKEFLAWANNDLALNSINDIDIPIVPYDCSGRVNRIWHVQKAGDVGVVTLDFDLKKLPFQAELNNFKLLIRNGSDVMSGATVSSITPTIIGDSVVRFENVPFANNDYFTLFGNSITPGGVSNHLVAWYKADNTSEVDLSGTTVTKWKDNYGNRDLTRDYALSTPTYQTAAPYLMNYNNSIQFKNNGVSYYQDLHNTTEYFPNTSGFHMITVGKDLETVDVLRATAGMGSNGNYPGLDLEDDVTNGWNFVMASSSPCSYYAQCGTQTGYPLLYNGYTGGTNQQSQIYSVGSTNTATTVGTANNIYTYIDGYKWLTDMDAFQQTQIGNQLYVGSSGGDAFWDGLVGEVLIYDGLLSDAEVLRINTYLAIKYGITLNQDQYNDYTASDGTIIYAASTYGAFEHDIAGIGLDSCSGLLQPKSTSVNADAVVTIESPTGFDKNRSFLVWANNDEDIDSDGIMEDGVYSGDICTNYILDKDWKVQLTNFNNKQKAVTVTFDRSKLTLTGNDFGLLIDTTGNTDYNHAYIIQPSSVTASTITFNGITQFTNGAVFTLATDITAYTAQLSTYGTDVTVEKCRSGQWIYLKNPSNVNNYYGAIKDSNYVLDMSKMTIRIDANSAYADLGDGDGIQAVRLMRRMLEVDCASCFDRIIYPAPHFTVRMLYNPAELQAAKDGSGGFGETEYLDVLTPLAGTPILQHWFKVDGLVSNILPVPAEGIHAAGQIWTLGDLPTGTVNSINYVDFLPIDSFSVFGYAISKAQIDNSPLPIELLSFNGINVGTDNLLFWTTTAEINNWKFIIEHSTDGANFTAIGEVLGAGNSSEMLDYQFTHYNPIVGNNYYRLKQVDYNGAYTYSNIVLIKTNSNTKQEVAVYPNPVANELNIVFSNTFKTNPTVNIYNTLGQTIYTNTIDISNNKIFKVDVSHLSKATYLLVIDDYSNNKLYYKFIKE